MKIFLKYFATPLLIGVMATLLFLLDAMIANMFVPGASFLWVGFIFWTIFSSSTIKDRIKGLIGVIIGFLSAILMMAITGSFTLNVWVISISSLVGVFAVNFGIMYFDKGEKLWLNSITGIFAGIAITFSGLGIGLSPLSSTESFFTTLGLILIYTILGLCWGLICSIFNKKIKNKLDQIENKK